MTFLGLQLNAGRVRFVYDVCLTAGASLFVFAVSRIFLVHPASYEIFLSIAILPMLNFLIGVYGSPNFVRGHFPFRIYEAFYRSNLWRLSLLSLTLLVSTLCLASLSENLGHSAIWFAIVWAPLLLPRYFLNLNSSVKRNFLSSAIQVRGPVLIVGGAGYIGSMVVEELLRNGRRVRILDKLLYGRSSIEDLLSHPLVELFEGDATDIMALTRAMNGASAVVHLAGLVGDPACSVDDTFTRHTNVIATRMVKEIAKSFGVPKFIFASSCSVYGISEEKVNESSPLNPVSIYARTKVDSEEELLRENSPDFHVSILRFATVFGHSRRPRFDLVANLFTAQAFIDGCVTLAGANQWRPFVHVRDLARAINLTLNSSSSKVSGEIFNVGDGELNSTIGNLSEIVLNTVRKIRPVDLSVNTTFTDTRNYNVSFDKIKKVLGFQASVSLQAGIEEIVTEFKKGTYGNYQESKFSNFHTTKDAIRIFQDPVHNQKLYRPLGDYNQKSA